MVKKFGFSIYVDNALISNNLFQILQEVDIKKKGTGEEETLFFKESMIGDFSNEHFYLNIIEENLLSLNILDKILELFLLNIDSINIDDFYFISSTENRSQILEIKKKIETINNYKNLYTFVKQYNGELEPLEIVHIDIISLENITLKSDNVDAYIYKNIDLNENILAHNNILINSRNNIETYNLLYDYIEYSNSNLNYNLFNVLYDIDFKLEPTV